MSAVVAPVAMAHRAGEIDVQSMTLGRDESVTGVSEKPFHTGPATVHAHWTTFAPDFSYTANWDGGIETILDREGWGFGTPALSCPYSPECVE